MVGDDPLGDWPATISRDEQQRITLGAILDALEAGAGSHDL